MLAMSIYILYLANTIVNMFTSDHYQKKKCLLLTSHFFSFPSLESNNLPRLRNKLIMDAQSLLLDQV